MVTPTSSSVTALLKNWPCLEAVWDCFGLENWLVITSVKQWFFFYYFFCSFVWFCFSLQRSESSPGLCRFISCWTRSLIRLYPRHRGREHSVWFSRNECRLCSYRVSPAILSFVCSSSILHFVCPLSRPPPQRIPFWYYYYLFITYTFHLTSITLRAETTWRNRCTDMGERVVSRTVHGSRMSSVDENTTHRHPPSV